jgi:hypothetical protein
VVAACELCGLLAVAAPAWSQKTAKDLQMKLSRNIELRISVHPMLLLLLRSILPSGSPSADAATRLVALEFAAQQQAAQLTTAARQLDKLQARVSAAKVL